MFPLREGAQGNSGNNSNLKAAIQKLKDAKGLLDKATKTEDIASQQNNVEMAIQAVITAATASDKATEAGNLAMKEKCKARILEPNLGLKGLSPLLVRIRFFTDCLTESISFSIVTSFVFGCLINDKSKSE